MGHMWLFVGVAAVVTFEFLARLRWTDRDDNDDHANNNRACEGGLRDSSLPQRQQQVVHRGYNTFPNTSQEHRTPAIVAPQPYPQVQSQQQPSALSPPRRLIESPDIHAWAKSVTPPTRPTRTTTEQAKADPYVAQPRPLPQSTRSQPTFPSSPPALAPVPSSNRQAVASPESPEHAPPSQRKHVRVDSDQANKRDPYYLSLRDEAKLEREEMHKRIDERKLWRSLVDSERMVEILTMKVGVHKKEMRRLDGEASAWIYDKNNENLGPNDINLHGLYVDEAKRYADNAVVNAKQRGDSLIRLIVGKGSHSEDGKAKLKPAVAEHFKSTKHIRDGIDVCVDPDNEGVLLVTLGPSTSSTKGRRRSVRAGHITRTALPTTVSEDYY